MKTRPIDPRLYRTVKEYEDYANSLGVNPEDLDGFHEIRILPKRYETRMVYSAIYSAIDEYSDDLYDPQIELETRQSNKNVYPR